MTYKFSNLIFDPYDPERNLIVVFQNEAENQIEMPLGRFARYVHSKGDMPYIPVHEFTRAGAAIIESDYDPTPVCPMTEAEARSLVYA